MFWVTLAIIVIGYLIYRVLLQNSPEYQKKLKEKQIQQLEAEANYWFNYVLEDEKKDIEKYQKDDEMLKATKDSFKALKELEKKYITLTEKFKHAPIDERYSLAQDWYDYNQIKYYRAIDMETREANNYYGDFEEFRDQTDKERLVAGEIIKRFDKRLASPL